MVVLGDAPARAVHVPLDSVGPLSLHGGYFRRDRYRHAGIRDWKMDHAEARGRGSGSVTRGRLQFWAESLRVGAFKCMRDAEQQMLVGNGAHQLQSHRKSVGRESTRDGKRGYPGKIRGAIVPQKKRA